MGSVKVKRRTRKRGIRKDNGISERTEGAGHVHKGKEGS